MVVFDASVLLLLLDPDASFPVDPATAHRTALEEGDKREGTGAIWAKVKFDRQIVAIARVEGATTIYSDDEDIKKLAARSGVNVIGIAGLPLPPEDLPESRGG